MTGFLHGTVGASGGQVTTGLALLDAFEVAATTQTQLAAGQPLPFASGDVAAGSDRVLVAIILHREGTVVLPTGVKLGTEDMTRIKSDLLAAAQDIGVDAWIINDAGIVAAGADPDIQASGSSGSTSNFRCFVGSFQNVDQTTPISASDANAVSGAFATLAALANEDGGQFVGGWIADRFPGPNDVNAAWTGATETLEDDVASSAYFSLSGEATTGTDINVSIASSGTDTGFRNGLIGFTLAPA